MKEKVDYILGIETSGPPTGLSVINRKGSTLFEVFNGKRFAHSELLNVMLKDGLSWVNLSLEDIGLVAVSIGPGYFTALRAGLSMAKALSFSLSIPLVGVSTLLALVQGITATSIGQIAIPVIDAQRGNVYAQTFLWNGERWIEHGEPGVFAPKDLKVRYPTAIFVGGGAEIHPELKPTPIQNPFVPLPSTIAKLGFLMYKEGKYHNACKLEPLYIRFADVKKKKVQ